LSKEVKNQTKDILEIFTVFYRIIIILVAVTVCILEVKTVMKIISLGTNAGRGGVHVVALSYPRNSMRELSVRWED
jgi:hypothetical protein